ncbi:MAG TPA: hypothetical protein PKW33_17510 [Anaerolineaceae bacterium]|nr:hypothetical protein [Anaerolineaceae bacterium]HPN53399.1 hypothetical protein [Anaerolineaceae bacterium]
MKMFHKSSIVVLVILIILAAGALALPAQAAPAAPTYHVFMPMVSSSYPIIPTLKPIDNADGDGDYSIYWEFPDSVLVSRYETEFSFNDPTFANGQTATVDYPSKYQMGIYTWPGVHYWRVRAYAWDDAAESYVPGPWSNVQSTTVGSFAYLRLNNESYAFNMEVQVSGNGINTSTVWDSRTFGFWRSLPVGDYTFTINHPLCYPSQRVQQISLANSISGGAWYVLDTCNSMYGPVLYP